MTLRRKCGACGGFVSPYETQTMAGIPFNHRYRCGCTTKFDILTGVGRFVLAALNVGIDAAIILWPDEKFSKSDDKTWILVFLLGVQTPLVFLLLYRSIKADRFHVRSPL